MGACSPWTLDLDCCDLPEDSDTDLVDHWQEVASDILWAASGRRYGVCEVIIRPCLRNCGGGTGVMWVPYKSGGEWRNYNACGCTDDPCNCTQLCAVVLPGPVASIVQVLVGDTELAAEDYRVDRVGSRWELVRVDGGCFPQCQDMSAECGAPDTLCITYEQGIELDALAIAAVSELTCQLVKACDASCKTCKLPANATQMVRRGVSITFENAQGWIRSLPMVNEFLNAVNPNGLQSASSVWSPDIPHVRVVPTDVVS